MPVSVEKKPFGVTKGGEAVNIYCIKNDMLAVEMTPDERARLIHRLELLADAAEVMKP